MNSNENKDIENHEHDILKELREGKHKDLISTNIYQYENLTGRHNKSHEEAIRQLTDAFRDLHKVDHTTATRCINEMLWEKCGLSFATGPIPPHYWSMRAGGGDTNE